MTWGRRQREFRQRGLDMEELTLSIPTRPPMTSSILFRLKSQGKGIKKKKKKDAQSFNTFLTFFLLQQYRGNKRTLFTPLHLKPLLKIRIYNCIISPKVSLPRASNMCQDASLLPNARASHKLMWTLKQNLW